jgi:hypothetical protein
VSEGGRARIAELRAKRDSFVRAVEHEVAERGGYVRPMRGGGPDRWVSLTPSTRSGVDWQVTYWEGNPNDPGAEPTGHIDVRGSVADAAKEMIGMVLIANGWEEGHVERLIQRAAQMHSFGMDRKEIAQQLVDEGISRDDAALVAAAGQVYAQHEYEENEPTHDVDGCLIC